jgi:two-component system, NtrC family, response regulator
VKAVVDAARSMQPISRTGDRPMALPKLLIVDDDEAIRLQLKYALQSAFRLSFAEDRAQALEACQATSPEVVLLDLGLPPALDSAAEGLKTLEEILTIAPGTKVVILTGSTDKAHALNAVQLGAFDHHLKPVDLDTLQVVLHRAAYLHGLEAENETGTKDRKPTTQFEEILGNTPAMREIFGLIPRVAKSDATVLILGESGTGKELIARAIHQRSRRGNHPFIPINCGAIPETLLESELFGHEKGSFTGAHVQRKGRLEIADRGTLFLDEIGELGLMLQVKLLRFLQERAVERVGGRQPIQLDLRVIAATNQDLKALMQRGLFRRDLYYRLSVVTIQVPALHDRGEDIPLLANAFLRRAGASARRRIQFTPEALRALMAYPWPGNIRELENKVSRALIMARGRMIEPADLDLEPVPDNLQPSLREARGVAERKALVDVLSRHRGNISHAARELKVSRPTVHSLLDKYDLDAKGFR